MRSKNLAVLFLLISFVVFSGLPARGQAADPAAATAATIDKYLTARTELGRFNGVALVAKDGKVILKKGYGVADIERKIPYTADTRQEVASITKMFTSMATLMLRDQGKLKLEDSICNYLDAPSDRCPEAWKPVTVQNLMRHTSGIPDYEEKLELFSPAHIAFMIKPDATGIIYADAKKLPLDFKPGEKFNYSNTGYIVLAHIVQKVSGESYYKFVEKNILKPAGMASSGMMNSLKPPAGLAAGYSGQNVAWDKFLSGFSVTQIGYQKVPQISLEEPAGDAALYSTVDDLYKWSAVMDGNTKLVSAKIAQEVFTPGLEGYGYGWFIDAPAQLGKRYSHTGGLPGYVTDFTKLPEKNLTVILFSNIESMRLSRARRDVVAIALGLPWDMPVSGKVAALTPDQCKNLLGDFKMADGTVMKISKEENRDWPIVAEVPKQYTAGLIPLSPTEFYMPLAEGRVTFTLDEQGRAIKVNIHYSGEDHVAERVQ